MHPAELEPISDARGIAKDRAKERFVVAFQEHHVSTPAALDQEVERRERVRSAIDIVAEIYLDRVTWPAVRNIGVDDRQHLFEQMRAAVNIADRVDPNSIRQPWLDRRFGGSQG